METRLETGSMLKALIFDVDGTLAETERDGHRLAFNQAFAEVGLNWHWSVEAYGKLTEIGGGKERIAYYIENFQFPESLKSQLQPIVEAQGFTTLNAWIADLHQRKSRHYAQILAQGGIRPRPGVMRLLQEAKTAGMPLAIATTSALPNALSLLETTIAPDSPDWFSVIAAGDMVPQKKPAPDIYQYVLAQLKLNPKECVVFEDSQVGLEAAKRAGLTTIVTLNDYTEGQDFSAADLVIDHLGEPDSPLQIRSNPHHYSPDHPLTYATMAKLEDFLNFVNALRASSAD
jgi:HAD superfamily hydrolase (TIGR01509 family)